LEIIQLVEIQKNPRSKSICITIMLYRRANVLPLCGVANLSLSGQVPALGNATPFDRRVIA